MSRIAKLVGLASVPGEALPCSLFAEVSRQGQFFGFAIFAANLLVLFFALLLPLPKSALAAW